MWVKLHPGAHLLIATVPYIYVKLEWYVQNVQSLQTLTAYYSHLNRVEWMILGLDVMVAAWLSFHKYVHCQNGLSTLSNNILCLSYYSVTVMLLNHTLTVSDIINDLHTVFTISISIVLFSHCTPISWIFFSGSPCMFF